MNLMDIFKVDKPVIGDVHLPPLPGSPKHKYTSTINDILEFVVREARIYAEGGLDGIIIENYGDMPYYPHKVGPETIAVMTYITSEVKKQVNIPIGIQVLRNDAEAAISVAHAVGGKFIRINVITEETVGEDGSIHSRAYDIHRFRKALGSENVKIFADIEHYVIPPTRDIADVAENLAHGSLADVIVISGGLTARKPDIRDIERIKSRRLLSNTPIFVAGGINKDNVQSYLKICDGIIIATSLKVDGISTNPTDPQRVKEFMKRVNEIR